MTKITFKDLPDTSTPLNASNLNTLQDNVENAINVVAGDIPTIDSSVSTSSTNPVENQAITNYVDGEITNINTTITTISGNLTITNITSQMTWKTGFSLADGRLWKQGKHIFGTLNISGTFTQNTQVIDVFTIPYSIDGNFVWGGLTTTSDQWSVPNGYAYCYMSQYGHFNLNCSNNAKFVRVMIDLAIV